MSKQTNSSETKYRKPPSIDDAAIYDSMLSAVIDQRLTPGTRLIEAELCEIYGTTRRSIERVLVRLEAEGVVTIERNRGARVAQPTVQDARDVFALRRIVEREVVRLLSGNMSKSARNRIEDSLEAERDNTNQVTDRSHIHHSGDFHVILADECGNSEIRLLVRRLVARTSLITQLFGNDVALECWHEEHIRLLELLVKGSTDEAEELMARHLDSIEGELRLLDHKDMAPDLRAALLGRKHF